MWHIASVGIAPYDCYNEQNHDIFIKSMEWN